MHRDTDGQESLGSFFAAKIKSNKHTSKKLERKQKHNPG